MTFLECVKKLRFFHKKIVRIYTAVILILIAACLFTLFLPKQICRVEGEYTFAPGSATQDTVLYRGFDLHPGVYSVELTYETDRDYSALCTVKDDYTLRGVKTNGEHLYKGLNTTGFHVWIYKFTDTCEVTLSYGGSGTVTVSGVTLRETVGLRTMLLALLCLGGAAGYILLAVFYACREGVVTGKNLRNGALLGLIVLIASLPYLRGYVISGVDLTYHLQRIEGVRSGLLSGQFPVRIQPEWLLGHGYADAVFYCNLLLYFPAVLRLLGFPVTIAYNAFGIALNIATACTAYYCFKRIFESDEIGLVCSALHVLSLYRIFRMMSAGAVGEASAMIFTPVVLYGLYRLFSDCSTKEEQRSAWLPLAIGYAGLIQTHVLSCELTAFVTIVVCIVYCRKLFTGTVLGTLCKGAAAAAGVSLWYLVPFLDYYITQDVNIKHASSRTIQETGLYPSHLLIHFWGEGPLVAEGDPCRPAGIGWVLLGTLALFLFLWLVRFLRRRIGGAAGLRPLDSFVKLMAVLGGGMLFMSLRLFPWDAIQGLHPILASLISSLQYTFRVLGWGTVCLIFVCGYCLRLALDKNRKLFLGCVCVCVIGVLTSGGYTIGTILEQEEDCFFLYNEEGMGFGYISGAEYIPYGNDYEKLTFGTVAVGAGVTVSDYEKEYLHVTMQCENTSGAESYVELPLLSYKGYHAYAVDSGEELEILAGDNKVIRVLLPGDYSGRVEVKYVSPLYWRAAELGSLLTVLFFCFRKRIRRINVQRHKPNL